jgi:hypothetical protein
MLSVFRRLFGKSDSAARVVTRLREEDVLEIAQKAADDHGLSCEIYRIATAKASIAEDKILWTASPYAHVGATISVTIDDETGTVVGLSEMGVR